MKTNAFDLFRALARALPACVALGVAACGPTGAAVETPKVTPRPPVVEAAPAGRRPGPPPAARRPVVREMFGVRVTDDYEWLEDAKNPEVRAFTDTQSAYARGVLDGISGRTAIRERVAQLLGSSAANYIAVDVAAGKLFVFVEQPPKQQPILVVRDVSGDAAGERVVVDPNTLDPTGKTTIDFFVPSPDAKLVAVSLSKDGSERGDVHVFDVATGKDRGDVIAHVNGGTAGGSVAWNEAASGFYYTRYPRAGERPEPDLDFFQQIYFHTLGTPEAADVYSFGKDLPRIAEIELQRSDDGRAILARVRNGDGGEAEHHVLRNPGSTWTRLSKFEDELSVATFGADGKVYAVSRKGAPRGKVIRFAPPFDKPAEAVLAEGDAVIEDLVVTTSALYLVEVVGGPSRMRRIPLGAKAEPLAHETPKPGKARPKGGAKGAATNARPPAPGERGVASAELPLAPISSVAAVVRTGDDLLVKSESFTDAPAWYRYRASEHRFVKTALAKISPADMSDVDVVRETCASKDGTKVPMSILRRKGTKLSGDLPTLLTGYGGFGVSRKPRLRAWYRVWLDQGGVVVETNLRGGNEMGEEWHRAGKLTKKQNVFDDFYACAKTLVELGYTKPDKLAITGRSNGGLLMGAAIVQHPEMYRAVVSGVGIYDVLRTELSPNGAFNVTEYGTVKDEAQFRAMASYSPLHNVKDGTAYPAILFTTGANDPRVDPYHSRKMLARLQGATSSDRPILLRASADTGHGMGTPLSAEIDETTDMLTFLLHELDVLR